MRAVAIRAVVAALLLLAAGAFAIDWNQVVLPGRQRETNDATVQGDPTQLKARVAGYLAAVPVSDYQAVRKGDLLYALEDVDYRARVARAKADAEEGEAAVKVAEAQLAQQQAEVDVAAAQIKSGEASLAYAHEERARQAALLNTESYLARDWQNAVAADQQSAAGLAGQRKALAAQQAQVEVRRAQLEGARASLAARRAALDYARVQLGYTHIAGAVRRRRDAAAGPRRRLRRGRDGADLVGAAAVRLGGGELPRGAADACAPRAAGGGEDRRDPGRDAGRPRGQPGAGEPGAGLADAAGPLGRQLHQGGAASAGEDRARPAAGPGGAAC